MNMSLEAATERADVAMWLIKMAEQVDEFTFVTEDERTHLKAFFTTAATQVLDAAHVGASQGVFVTMFSEDGSGVSRYGLSEMISEGFDFNGVPPAGIVMVDAEED